LPENSLPEVQKIEQQYYTQVQNSNKIIPDLKGMDAMDAVALMENLGMQVRVDGVGKVTAQSVAPGTRLKGIKNITITLG
jgi:cell division protein FtsI (penicillin-binding protein 3)